MKIIVYWCVCAGASGRARGGAADTSHGERCGCDWSSGLSGGRSACGLHRPSGGQETDSRADQGVPLGEGVAAQASVSSHLHRKHPQVRGRKDTQERLTRHIQKKSSVSYEFFTFASDC